jgi:hypothetical protein
MAQSESLPPVEIHLEKSSLFRVVHADGVWSSVNPWGDLHLAFYNERAPIPQRVYWEPDGKGGWKELRREGKSGWFREVEVDIALSREAAQLVLKAIQYYLAPPPPPAAPQDK